MPIPDYQTRMLPLLKLTGDAKEHSLREAIDALADEFRLIMRGESFCLAASRQCSTTGSAGQERT